MGGRKRRGSSSRDQFIQPWSRWRDCPLWLQRVTLGSHFGLGCPTFHFSFNPSGCCGSAPSRALWGWWFRVPPVLAHPSTVRLVRPLSVLPPQGSAGPHRSAGMPSTLVGDRRCRSRSQARSDLAVIETPRSLNRRGSMPVALEVASSEVRLTQATDELRAAFFAKCTERARNNRRFGVESLAHAVANSGAIYPLIEQLVFGGATSLRGAGFRSAAPYLDELRVGHIEAECRVEAWLVRVLTNCKRSLVRGLGPVNRVHRALELRLCDLVPQVLADRRRLGLIESPLFPTASGGVALKDAIVTSWRKLGSTLVDVTGHSPRRSGAKCLARLGWSLADIQLLGCWQSDVVKSYVEEA
eukprot:6492636-Amphidinium_carterae.1